MCFSVFSMQLTIDRTLRFHLGNSILNAHPFKTWAFIASHALVIYLHHHLLLTVNGFVLRHISITPSIWVSYAHNWEPKVIVIHAVTIYTRGLVQSALYRKLYLNALRICSKYCGPSSIVFCDLFRYLIMPYINIHRLAMQVIDIPHATVDTML